MKLVVAGSRDLWSKKTQIRYYLEAAIKRLKETKNIEIMEIVHGLCPNSPDMIGDEYALEHNLEVCRFPADWEAHGKKAGHLRNKEMAAYGDILIVFWDGKSRGTKNMIDEMKKLDKPVILFTF